MARRRKAPRPVKQRRLSDALQSLDGAGGLFEVGLNATFSAEAYSRATFGRCQ
jgi:hypothetical protein